MGNRRAIVDLFLASALSLFVELIFIRWVSSELRIFSFYRNLALIGAFLGMGLGFATYRAKQGAPWFEKYYLLLVAVVALCVVAIGWNQAASWLTVVNPNAQEFIWSQVEVANQPISPLLNGLFYVAMLTIFSLITIVFVPIGELVASRFGAFKPLHGYTINTLGSLVGIVLYTAVSFLNSSPPVWARCILCPSGRGGVRPLPLVCSWSRCW